MDKLLRSQNQSYPYRCLRPQQLGVPDWPLAKPVLLLSGYCCLLTPTCAKLWAELNTAPTNAMSPGAGAKPESLWISDSALAGLAVTDRRGGRVCREDTRG